MYVARVRPFISHAIFIAPLLLLLVPASALAQASITGVVKDASGAVLPGVTVEASSPALIEKVRSAITDGAGQYRIVDLRPGVYAVAFTLPGFSTLRRDNVELTGSFTATVNADLRVGGVEETVTVTGESPVVDVQSATKQRVLTAEVIEAIPSGRSQYNLGVLIPGASVTGGQDVGGSAGLDAAFAMTIHGSTADSQRITQNGITLGTILAGGYGGGAVPNASATSRRT